MGKGDDVCYQHFLLMFQFFQSGIKTQDCFVQVDRSFKLLIEFYFVCRKCRIKLGWNPLSAIGIMKYHRKLSKIGICGPKNIPKKPTPGYQNRKFMDE